MQFNTDNRNPENLQRDLSQLMIEKDRLEQEFWRAGTNAKTKVQIQKKRELEQSLENTSQQIQSVKQRLRDMNALV